ASCNRLHHRARHRARCRMAGRDVSRRATEASLNCPPEMRDERALREAIVATARAMNAAGINRGTSGNVSARIDGGFLITPSGVPYHATASTDVVAMSEDGEARGS